MLIFQRMTFAEFCELLPMVVCQSLYEIDPELSPIHHMPISWYQGLAKVLINKNTLEHRVFTSPDELIKYVVSFQSPSDCYPCVCPFPCIFLPSVSPPPYLPPFVSPSLRISLSSLLSSLSLPLSLVIFLK